MSNRSARLLAAAAMTGLVAGPTAINLNCNRKTAPSGPTTNTAGTPGETAVASRHSCKGKNACKGQGGCGSSDNGCKGKNSCKGKGGCAM